MSIYFGHRKQLIRAESCLKLVSILRNILSVFILIRMGQGTYGTCYISRMHVNISSKSLLNTISSTVKNEKKEKYICVTFVYLEIKIKSKT